MALRISLQRETTLPLDFSGITPDPLRSLSSRKIERLPILCGNELLPLAEVCKISGDAGDGCLELSGNLAHAHGIGAGMSSGQIHLDGNAGRNVGLGMRGGEIHISGDGGDDLGCEMRGGTIRVAGSVGDRLGGARCGASLGMNGGVILVDGNAGLEVGLRMRRGLIAIGGNAGSLVGHGMLAGTIVVYGNCGAHAGVGMKRGTLFLLGAPCEPLPATFRFGSVCTSPILPLTEKTLIRQGFHPPGLNAPGRYDLYHGDFLSLGRGEVVRRVAGGGNGTGTVPAN